MKNKRHEWNLTELPKQLTCKLSMLIEIKELLDGDDLKAILPNEIKRQLKEGVLQFAYDEDGGILAQVRKKGKIAKQIRLESMPKDVSGILNNYVLQAQYANLTQRMETMAAMLQTVVRGQYSDRFSMIMSGKKQVEKAYQLSGNVARKETMLLNGIKSLEDGRAMLEQTIQLDIVNVMNNPTNIAGKIAKGADHKKINEKIQLIKSSYQNYIEGTQVEFVTFMGLEEYETALSVVEEARVFLEDNFSKEVFIRLDSSSRSDENYWLKEPNNDIEQLEFYTNQIHLGMKQREVEDKYYE